MLNCETCGKNPGIAVLCVPGVPYSASYCQECLNADAHPYNVLVANTACCGGLEKMHQGWQEMVGSTLKHLGKTETDFLADVYLSMLQLEKM